MTINNSGVLVVWTTQNQDGKWDVYGKWFLTSIGNTERPELQVNTTSSDAASQSAGGHVS